MRRSALLLLALAAASPAAWAQSAAGAALWGQQPALPVAPQLGEAAAALESYRLPAERFPIALGEPERHRSYVVQRASFPSPLTERWPEVTGSLYLPAREVEGRLPAAVVVHHLGGSFEAEAYLAQHLAQHGVAAFAISLPNYGERREPGTRQGFLREEDPVGSFLAFRQAALDVIRAGDVLRALPQVDAERVGAVGVSLGAIVTALARGVDPRLGKTVLVLGGGDIRRILEESSEVPTGLLERADVEPGRLAEVLAPVDPLTFAGRVAPEDVLMFNARRDEVIPPACTRSLWEAYGRPELRWFDCGHYGAVLHALTVMNGALDHLRERPSRERRAVLPSGGG